MRFSLAATAVMAAVAPSYAQLVQEIPLGNEKSLAGPASVNVNSCLAVVMFAFGSSAGNINLQTNGYLRWGNEQCVIQITAPGSNGVTYQTNQVREAFVRLLVGTGEQAETGASMDSSDGFNVNFLFSSPAAFGGDTGQPVKRDAEPECESVMMFMYGHTSMPEIAEVEPWVGWKHNTAKSEVFNFTPRDIDENNELDAVVQRKVHARDLSGLCSPTVNESPSNSFSFTCACRGRIVEIYCNGGVSGETTWTWTQITSAANEFFGKAAAQIRAAGAIGGGGAKTQLMTGLYSNGYGFLQTAGDQYLDDDNTCCNQAIMEARRRNPGGGPAPPVCVCKQPSKDWMMTFNSMASYNVKT